MLNVLDELHFSDGEERFCPVDSNCPHCGRALELVQDLPAFRAYYRCPHDDCSFYLRTNKRYGCVAASKPETPSYDYPSPEF